MKIYVIDAVVNIDIGSLSKMSETHFWRKLIGFCYFTDFQEHVERTSHYFHQTGFTRWNSFRLLRIYHKIQSHRDFLKLVLGCWEKSQQYRIAVCCIRSNWHSVTAWFWNVDTGSRNYRKSWIVWQPVPVRIVLLIAHPLASPTHKVLARCSQIRPCWGCMQRRVNKRGARRCAALLAWTIHQSSGPLLARFVNRILFQWRILGEVEYRLCFDGDA